MKSTHKVINIAKIFMKEFFRMHGIPKTIISYMDTKFTSNFWKALFSGLDTQWNFSIAYHSQTNGQTERTNRIVNDMLRMYVMD
jgi:arsenate reductase-like glutaredoxin family protein